MTKFFMQHVGEALSKRDFPRSLGQRPDHFEQFSFRDLQDMADGPLGFTSILLEALSSGGPYQIWGLPAGAEPYTKQMFPGDWLMLLGSEKTCEYIGRIAAKVPRFAPEVSIALWREPKFPTIVMLED